MYFKRHKDDFLFKFSWVGGSKKRGNRDTTGTCSGGESETTYYDVKIRKEFRVIVAFDMGLNW